MKRFFLYSIVFMFFVKCSALTSLVITLEDAENEKSILDRFKRQVPINQLQPQLYDLKIETSVVNRFAKTLITGKIRNPGEISISTILPAAAYITGFVIETGQMSYEAKIASREEAQVIFDKAAQRHKMAGLVEANIRDSNNFTVSILVSEKYREASYKLAYDELLQRQNGQYEIITNLYPREFLENLEVRVKIRDSNPLKFVRALPFRSGLKTETSLASNPFVKIDTSLKSAAVVKLMANKRRQFEIASTITPRPSTLAAQLVVQYEVERQCAGGDVLLKDDFFVHFFAPCNLTNLPKEVIFVLDKSGSMQGLKLAQLKQAMDTILRQIRANDYFTIVKFSGTSKIWAPQTPNSAQNLLVDAASPTPQNIKAAIDYVYSFIATWDGTDILGALTSALRVARPFQDATLNYEHEPIIIFLTDGDANTGVTNRTKIIQSVENMNTGPRKVPIFCISLGEDADRDFLRRLCANNNGFLRHIYADTDASKQLVNFYNEISPISLIDVRFGYDNSKEVTKHNFPQFFDGYELVVSGKKEIGSEFAVPTVTAQGPNGSITLVPEMGNSVGSLEKNWAYMTVKQILEARNVAKDKKKFDDAALKLAKKYKFVTPVSSMVVETPDGPELFETEKTSDSGMSFGFTPIEIDLDVEEIYKNNDGTYAEYLHNYADDYDDSSAGMYLANKRLFLLIFSLVLFYNYYI